MSGREWAAVGSPSRGGAGPTFHRLFVLSSNAPDLRGRTPPQRESHAGATARKDPPRWEPELQNREEPAQPAEAPRPVLEVCSQSVVVHAGGAFEERSLPVLRLWFRYGSQELRVTDKRDGFFVSQAGSTTRVQRDRAAEQRYQTVLESFGAVELCCLDDIDVGGDADADYLVSINDSVHALCSFSAYAIPQLRRLGFDVVVASDYPFQVVAPDAPWFADVAGSQEEDDDQKSDWFSLELGVEVDGERHNLLPALLEVLGSGTDAESLSSLFRSHGRFRALPVGENRYVVMPPERLKLLLLVLEELHGEDPKRLKFTREAANVVAALDDVFEDDTGQLTWCGDTRVIDSGRAVRARCDIGHAAVAPGLRATLREYQQEGLNWLQHLTTYQVGGVLADDMGLGKTLQTIAHLATEKQSGRMVKPALVVVPTSLTGNWQREIGKFAPFLRVLVLQGAKRHSSFGHISTHDVVVTTYPVIVRDLERFVVHDYHLLILDEAQAIKNARSLAAEAVGSIRSEHRLCITGTPVENNLGELWSLFNFLMPGFLGNRSQFRSRYQTPIEREGNEVRLQQLRARVAPYILRRMKNTVAKDLPPKTELVRPVELEGLQRDLYESIRLAAHSQVRSIIKKKGLAGSTIAILDALMKLRQACCDPRLIQSDAARQVTSSAKYEFLMDLLGTQLQQGRRILIFSQFTRMLALIADGLRRSNEPFIALTGATVDRQKKCDEFERGDANVFLISLKAGGTGLNLTSADTVIHYDPWWNPAAQAQATDRAYRIGQKRPVFVYNLIVAGSVEERMLRLQEQKRHLADTILGQAGSALSENELEDLFAPLS